MAEPLSRSQILQQQIDNLQKVAPPPLTREERDQIMKGRKGQADIDAGRKAIADRERAISEHNSKVNDLLGKLDTAARDEGNEATRREREGNANPLLNTTLPALAGGAGGAAIGEIENRILHSFNKGNAEAVKGIARELGPVENLTNSQINRSRAAGAAAAAEKYAPSGALRQAGAVAGRGLSYGIPAGVFYNEYSKYHGRAEDPNATDADKLANGRVANALLGVSTGIAADGGMRFFFPSRHDGEGEAMARINAARDFARRMDTADEGRNNALLRPNRGSVDVTQQPQARAQTIDLTAEPARPALPAPQAQPAPSSEAAKAQAEKLRHSERLSRAVEAVGGKAGRAKSANYQALSRGVTAENAAAVAKALDLPSGSTKGAILQRARELMNTKGVSAFAPLVAGATGALAAMSDDANAADGTQRSVSDRVGNAAVSGGVAAGGAYGVNRLLRALPATVGGALSTMGPMSVATMDEPAPEVTDQYRNLAARTLPRALQFGAVDDAYQAAQVPEPSPYRQQPLEAAQSLEVPQGIPAPNDDGSSPYGDPGGGEVDFETQMAELTAMLSEIGAAQEPGPVANAVQSQRVASMPQQQPMYQPQMQRNALLR